MQEAAGGTGRPAQDRGPVLEQRGQRLRLPQQQAGEPTARGGRPDGEWGPGHEEGGDEPTAPEASSEFLRKNLDSILKSRDITFLTKVLPVKAMVFPVVMYGCESWTIKKAKCQRIDAFELWIARRSNQSILKESVLNIHWKDRC